MPTEGLPPQVSREVVEYNSVVERAPDALWLIEAVRVMTLSSLITTNEPSLDLPATLAINVVGG